MTKVVLFTTWSEPLPEAKVAVTDRSTVIVTPQVAPVEESQPVQPVKAEPASAVAVSVTAAPELKEALHVVPQLIPPPVTVPVPLPPFTTVSACVVPTVSKVAVTDRAAAIVTLQVVPVAESQPVQPAKAEPASAAAVSVTAAPVLKEALQVVPQLIPPPVTVPAPLPPFTTVSAWVTGRSSKVAMTDRSTAIVMSQVVPVAESQPVQPAKTEPASAVAVSVTAVPELTEALHVAPQLIPPPVTVPVPLPPFTTVSAWTRGVPPPPPPPPPPQAARPTASAASIGLPAAMVVMATPRSTLREAAAGRHPRLLPAMDDHSPPTDPCGWGTAWRSPRRRIRQSRCSPGSGSSRRCCDSRSAAASSGCRSP